MHGQRFLASAGIDIIFGVKWCLTFRRSAGCFGPPPSWLRHLLQLWHSVPWIQATRPGWPEWRVNEAYDTFLQFIVLTKTTLLTKPLWKRRLLGEESETMLPRNYEQPEPEEEANTTFGRKEEPGIMLSVGKFHQSLTQRKLHASTRQDDIFIS